ncbi:early nodulin-like protein 7 [Typha angustifolia]|uniref:early nodulin-like protein 7 n=1 Tax=Typha angustifolia TaxID=59011 RepID=UPI003C2E8CC2
MASTLKSLIIFFTTTSSIIFAVAAGRYKVGDAVGWRLPDMNNTELYETWASKVTFHVGDSILFTYQNDSVVRVDKRGYYHCNESVHGTTFKDGNTLVVLDRPGFYYYVSGYIDHCKKGQRLMIEVIVDRRTPPAISAPSPAPMPSEAASWTVSSFHILVSLCYLLLMMALLYPNCLSNLLSYVT